MRPAPWNGLKLFGHDGAVLPPAEGKKVQAIYEQQAFRRAIWSEVGQSSDCAQALDWHRDRVLQLVDVERIRARRFRVLLDANGGAGGPLGLRLLQYLNCLTTPLGCEADGNFAHEPEPIAARSYCPKSAARGEADSTTATSAMPIVTGTRAAAAMTAARYGYSVRSAVQCVRESMVRGPSVSWAS